MLRLAFDFIITWRETRTRPNAYQQHVVFLVFQLRAVELVAANPAVRSWQPQGPQLENGVFMGQCKNLRGNICKNPIFA